MYSEEKFVIRKYNRNMQSLVEDFNCGIDDIAISEYLRDQAIDDEKSVTYLVLKYDESGMPVKTAAFISLSCSAILKHQFGATVYDPAILIRYFAVDVEYQGWKADGFDKKFSDVVFAMFFSKMENIAKRHIGAKHIVLYASSERAERFYLRNHFNHFNDLMNRDEDPYVNDCVPMYFTIT